VTELLAERIRNIKVTATVCPMIEPRTGAERYLAHRLTDREYRTACEDAKERIDQIDSVIRALDDRRADLRLTKAELARRAGVKPEAIRRLFSTERPNPTLATLVALADALGLELRPEPRGFRAAPTPPSGASGTQRRRA
jgi:DNA-binding phage protein